METRRAEILARQETARGELGDARQLFGRELIAGVDVEKLSRALSQKEAALTIMSAGLSELDAQILAQQAVVSEAEVALASAETSATMKLIVKDAVDLVKLFANAQIDIHRNIERTGRLQSLRQEHGVRGGLHNIDWNGVANYLQQAQVLLETPEVKEKSRMPDAGNRGGFIDDTRTVATLGSAVRDWARQEVSR